MKNRPKTPSIVEPVNKLPHYQVAAVGMGSVTDGSSKPVVIPKNVGGQ